MLFMLFLLLLDYVQDEYPLRLQDSNVPGQGRLEVFYLGQWGTVCDNGWGQNEARVRSLLIIYSTYTHYCGSSVVILLIFERIF